MEFLDREEIMKAEDKFIKEERFISNDLIKILEKEINLVKEEKVDLERSKAIAELAHLIVEAKRIETKKERILIQELSKEINEQES